LRLYKPLNLYKQRLFTSIHYLLYLHHQQDFYQTMSNCILNHINEIIETMDPVDAIAIENLKHGLWEIGGVLQFYGLALNTPGSPPRPLAPAVATAVAATVTLAVAVLVRVHFRWLHWIHQTSRLHRY
jgi:hypothetical protein